MSKKNNTNGTTNNGIAELISQMQPVTPSFYPHRPEVDGEMNPIAGILCAKRPVKYRDGRQGEQYIISITHPCQLWNGDEGESFQAEPGTFAIVAARPALAELDNYLPSAGKVCEVAINPLKKVAISGGRTMWRFSIYARQLDADSVTVPMLAQPTSTTATVSEPHDEAQEEIMF